MTGRGEMVESILIGDGVPLNSPILSYRVQPLGLSDSSMNEASASPGMKTGTETIMNSCTEFTLQLNNNSASKNCSYFSNCFYCGQVTNQKF